MNSLPHRLLVLFCLCLFAPCAQAYYEPGSGRFLSADPLGHEASMSLYDYSGGDPVNYVDPDGRLKAAASKGITMGFLNMTKQVPAMADLAVEASSGAVIARAVAESITGTDLRFGHMTEGFFSGLERDTDSFMDAEARANGADPTSATYLYGTATFATGAELAPMAAGAIANGGVRAAGGLTGFLKGLFGGGGAQNKALQLPATDASLIGSTKLGYTTPQGNVFLRPGLTHTEQAYVLRHEGVHVFLTPEGGGRLATFRQNLGQFGYDNSQLLRFTEEVIAETRASGSLLQGLSHPFVNPYAITPGGLLLEGGAVGGGLFGAGYFGYKLGGN